MEEFLLIIYIIALFGGLWLIGLIFSWIGKLIERHREKIRDEVLKDVESKIDIQKEIEKHKKKLEHINYKREEGPLGKYFKQYNVKLIGEFGNFLKDCPACKKGRLVARKGKYGNFIGCSGFPNCKYTKNVKAAKAEYKKTVSEQFMKDMQKAYN